MPDCIKFGKKNNATERSTAPSSLVRGTIATHRHGDTRRTVHPRGVPVAGGTSSAVAAGPRLHRSAGPTEEIRVAYTAVSDHQIFILRRPRVPSLSARVSRLSGFCRIPTTAIIPKQMDFPTEAGSGTRGEKNNKT